MINATASAPRKVFLFSGHMIDAPGRPAPRFPAAKEPIAAAAIDDLLGSLDAGSADLAICGGACGGDLLFDEAARARGVPTEIYLPFDEAKFLPDSVDFAGADWHDRFLAAARAARGVHVLAREYTAFDPQANPYEQNNQWMLEAAGRFGSGRIEFICLWNGQGGDGPGGSQHLMSEVQSRAGRTHWLDTTKLW